MKRRNFLKATVSSAAATLGTLYGQSNPAIAQNATVSASGLRIAPTAQPTPRYGCRAGRA